MKIVRTHRPLALDHPDQRADAACLLGIAAGIGLMLPGFLMAEATLLLLPAFLVLVPSLLYGMR